MLYGLDKSHPIIHSTLIINGWWLQQYPFFYYIITRRGTDISIFFFLSASYCFFVCSRKRFFVRIVSCISLPDCRNASVLLFFAFARNSNFLGKVINCNRRFLRIHNPVFTNTCCLILNWLQQIIMFWGAGRSDFNNPVRSTEVASLLY